MTPRGYTRWALPAVEGLPLCGNSEPGAETHPKCSLCSNLLFSPFFWGGGEGHRPDLRQSHIPSTVRPAHCCWGGGLSSGTPHKHKAVATKGGGENWVEGGVGAWKPISHPPPPPGMGSRVGLLTMPGEGLRGRRGGGGGWHKASVLGGLPLAAPIGLSPLLIPTPCGSKRILVVSTEPLDDLSCLTTPGSAVLETGCCRCR